MLEDSVGFKCFREQDEGPAAALETLGSSTLAGELPVACSAVYRMDGMYVMSLK